MKIKIRNTLLLCIMMLYVFMLLDLLFRFGALIDFDRDIVRSWNIIPFHTIGNYLFGDNSWERSSALPNILGNILIFVPCGLFLQVYKKNKGIKESLVIIIVASAAVELVQLVFGVGVCDIDDVMLNSLGGLLGILLYKGFKKVFKYEERTRTATTALSSIIGFPIVFLYFNTVFLHFR